MTGTAGQLRVPIKFIQNYSIVYPKSIESQQKIVQEIESHFSVIDKLQEVIESSLNKTEKLRKSILKSAFEEELVKAK
jgi:restriction endonuclease S subunit